jgi:NADPH2 dehydrogenase
MRLSPFSDFQGMGMVDPIPQFSHIIRELKKLDLAYLHLVEPRVGGTSAMDPVYASTSHELGPLVALWGTKSPILIAGGFTPDKAKNALKEVYIEANVAVAFGRSWISNPDLAFRIPQGIELTKWDRETFYKRGSAEGYLGYPFSKEWEAREKDKETERSRLQVLALS